MYSRTSVGTASWQAGRRRATAAEAEAASMSVWEIWARLGPPSHLAGSHAGLASVCVPVYAHAHTLCLFV